MSERAREGDRGVALQISVAPGDLPHARHTLPHQLRQWARQVDEVVFTLDLGSDGGYRDRDRVEGPGGLEELLTGLCADHPHARVVRVDHTRQARDEVGRRLFGGAAIPLTDCYGKVVYAYFFGLLATRHRYVLHIDSDMLFGGGSETWVAEARRLLSERPDVFSCAPLPGPPSDRPLRRRVAAGHAGSPLSRARSRNAVPFASPGLEGPALRFSRLSTRDFLLDRSVFDDGALAMGAHRARLSTRLAALVRVSAPRGRSGCEPAESLLSRALTARDLMRIDFLGSAPGMWSVHPPLRSEAFYRALPDLIRRIEAGDVPEGQRGDYDLNDSMVDWSGARAQLRRRRWRGWSTR